MLSEEKNGAHWVAAAHFEMPILSKIVFGGPLLRHHLRASWRWRWPRGRALNWWKLGALLFVLANLIAGGLILAVPDDAEGMLISILVGLCVAVPVFVAASCGLSIARDRELGTWNGLRLSSIRASEIARAKMLTPLVSGLAYAMAVALPLLLLSWQVARSSGHFWSGSDSDDWSHETQFFCGLALAFPFWLLGTLQLAGWSLLCSLRARRSSIALVAAFAGGLIFLIGLPFVFSLCHSYTSPEVEKHLFHWLGLLHPLAALASAGEIVRHMAYSWDSHTDVTQPWLAYFFALLSHATLALALFHAVVAHIAAREK